MTFEPVWSLTFDFQHSQISSASVCSQHLFCVFLADSIILVLKVINKIQHFYFFHTQVVSLLHLDNIHTDYKEQPSPGYPLVCVSVSWSAFQGRIFKIEEKKVH